MHAPKGSNRTGRRCDQPRTRRRKAGRPTGSGIYCRPPGMRYGEAGIGPKVVLPGTAGPPRKGTGCTARKIAEALAKF